MRRVASTLEEGGHEYNVAVDYCLQFESKESATSNFQMVDTLPETSSETQGFNGDGGGKEMGARKTRKTRGRGRGRKLAKGSPGNLLYTEHFSIEEQTPLARCETEALV